MDYRDDSESPMTNIHCDLRRVICPNTCLSSFSAADQVFVEQCQLGPTSPGCGPQEGSLPRPHPYVTVLRFRQVGTLNSIRVFMYIEGD